MKKINFNIGKCVFSCLISFLIPLALVFNSCKKEFLELSDIELPDIIPPPSDFEMTSFGSLSEAKYFVVPAAAGSKILFAGGFYIVPNCFYDSTDNIWYNCRNISTKVDLYDTTSKTWSVVELARYYVGLMSAASAGNKIFFAGGSETADNSFSNKVDIYDALTDSWTTDTLSETRTNMALIGAGNKVFFAGGIHFKQSGTVLTDKVDIYNLSTNKWSTARLSEARCNIAATVVGNKVIFAGGDYGGWSPTSGTVDIYDVTTNTWSTSTLSEERSLPSATTLGNKAFFIGGRTGFNSPYSKKVDIYDSGTNSWSVMEVNFYLDHVRAVSLKGNIFLYNGHGAHIYNAATNGWSEVTANQELNNSAIIGVGNNIFFAGSGSDGGGQSDLVWRIRF